MVAGCLNDPRAPTAAASSGSTSAAPSCWPARSAPIWPSTTARGARRSGSTRRALLDTCVAAVEEARDVAGEDVVAAVGFGIPCTIDRRTGVAVYSTHLPIVDLPFARADVASGSGLPVAVDNDATCAVLAEARYGAGAGLLERGAADARAPASAAGCTWTGACSAAPPARGAEMGHMVIDADGPPCQGACPNRGCLEALASGSALVREAALRVGREPDTPLGRAMEEGVRADRPARDRVRPRRRSGRTRRDRP